MRLGIVTVLYRSEANLPELFASLAAQSYRGFTVFAVDNASGDSSLALCREHGAVCIENAENRGVAAANNQGIRAALDAGCELVLLLNNDVRFGPELLTQLIDGLREQQCEMATPLIYFYDRPQSTQEQTIWCAGGGFQHWLSERPFHIAEGQRDTDQFTEPHRVEFAPTCCVLIRREVFERVGMMDEHYFVYWDDTDFMLRSHRSGVTLYLIPAAKLWHKIGALEQSDFTVRYATRNHAYYLRKHLVFPLAVFWWSLYCVVFAVGAVASRRMRIKLRAWLDGAQMPLP